jgi:oligopeptide/dipeptide ABC transporter ATP-binding protein
MADALLELRGVSKSYRARGATAGGRPTVAVDDVSLTVGAGESVGIIGDSGAGKSTLAWMAAGLLAPTSGSILVNGIDVTRASAASLRTARRSVGLVFQDALGSFNPMRTVEHALALPLDHYLGLRGVNARTAIGDMMERVGLRASQMTRYPHEFSGGQIQRLAIARALIARPPVVVLDEPVSALDVSIRAQILNLLRDLAAEFKLAYLLIATDPAVVEHMTDRLVVMYAGRILEESPREAMFVRPRHPYTVSLLSLGDIDGRIVGGAERGLLPGRVAAAVDRSLDAVTGCPFSGSCPLELPICRDVRPELVPAGAGQLAACHAYAATGSLA